MLKKIKPIWSRIGLMAAAAFLTMSGATAQQPAATAPGQALVLTGGTLIDGTGKAPIPNAVVVVQGTRITAVGRRGQVRIPANAKVINLAGRTILPGLLDIHVHSEEWQYPMFLHYGVTTFADLDNDTAWIFSQRAMTRNGRIKGPRMFVAGGKVYGGLAQAGGRPLPQNATVNRTVEEARAHARRMAEMGADLIKIDDTLSYDQLAAVIEEGKRAGLKVIGHTQNIRKAAEMGTYFEEHMDTMARAILDPDGSKFTGHDGRLWYPQRGPLGLPQVSPEEMINPSQFPPLIQFMVQKGVYLNPTLANAWIENTPRAKQMADERELLAKDPGLAFVPASQKRIWTGPTEKPAPGYSNISTFIRQYVEAGGKVVVGTDAAGGQTTVPGLSEHYEMMLLVDVGVPPMKALQAATLWNAEAIGKEKDLGSLEPGKLADFTIIEGDPLKDISATKNVRMVIKDGAVVDTAYDPKFVNPIPEPYKVQPSIRTMYPLMASQGGPAVTLEVEGSGFLPNAVVRLDNADLPTQFVSSNKLTATIGVQLLGNVGTYPLYVVNRGPLGNVSQSKSFLVDFKN